MGHLQFLMEVAWRQWAVSRCTICHVQPCPCSSLQVSLLHRSSCEAWSRPLRKLVVLKWKEAERLGNACRIWLQSLLPTFLMQSWDWSPPPYLSNDELSQISISHCMVLRSTESESRSGLLMQASRPYIELQGISLGRSKFSHLPR